MLSDLIYLLLDFIQIITIIDVIFQSHIKTEATFYYIYANKNTYN